MKENEPTAIGRRLRYYRERLGIKSATDLAARIPNERITAVVIQNLEAGRKGEPTVGELFDIAGGLKISPLLLMFDLERPFANVDLEVSADLTDGTMLDTANWLGMTIYTSGNEESRVIETRAAAVLSTSNYVREALHWLKVEEMFGAQTAESFEALQKIRSELAQHLNNLEHMGIDLSGIEKSEVLRRALYG